MRIDSHQHFWSLQRGDYHWLTPALDTLYRDFLPPDLQPMLQAAGVQRTILVQAAASVAETEYLLSLAGKQAFIAGVVGWVDMDDPTTALDDLRRLRENDSLLGVRPMIQDIADPDWMLRDHLMPVFEQLIASNLRFDALVLPAHLKNLRRLLDRHPRLACVIDHAAKPAIASASWQPWADDMVALAASTNCYCKLSGLLTEAGARTDDDALRPYVEHLLACFGAQRLMWGSDWPVLTLASRYGDWVQQSERLLQHLGSVDQEAIFGATAKDFYGLD
ncbi:MAG: amidohydrolase family protein [Haliea sp.]|nr:amidohydrolase family protein [Haliea sp.]